MDLLNASPGTTSSLQGVRTIRAGLAVEARKLSAASDVAGLPVEAALNVRTYSRAVPTTTATLLQGLQTRAAELGDAAAFVKLQDYAEHLSLVSSLGDISRAQHDGVLRLLGSAGPSALQQSTFPSLLRPTPVVWNDTVAGAGGSYGDPDMVSDTDSDTDTDTVTDPEPVIPTPDPEPEPTPHFMGYVLGAQVTSGSNFMTAEDKSIDFVSGPIMIEYIDDDGVLNGDDAVNERSDDATQFVVIDGTQYTAAIDYLIEDSGTGAVFAVIDYDINGDGIFDDAENNTQDGKILVQLSGPVPTDGSNLVMSATQAGGIDTAYADLPQSS
ncbi:hypothetical protein [Acuticoccus sp. I52.16.1]|uniref:hypothetical protein n=1 Tax=Acuticoccus sp. I52.16.1 TaxID=2928472 RepID=UPI001FD39031|nr:hypothetical protein [Acuticoccus sp. I52.16.1]UOM33732.1 hypothetical protein MRB58_18105 [Acuticoccus sp. I52.16.1]